MSLLFDYLVLAEALAEEAREKSEDLASYTEEEILDLNDRLMLVERGFCIDKSEHTLYKRPDVRH